ncbi:hypothetical protein N9195_02830 [bacterium]|jgi:hypothetical protein|nr:hypothetical protein [bacterium]
MNTPPNEKPEVGAPRKNQREAADILGWSYLVIGVATIFCGLGLAALAMIDWGYFAGSLILGGGLMLIPGILWVFAGQSLRKRQHWWYCFIVGLLTLPIVIPVGTVLGICTIQFLNRSDIRAAFGRDQTG